MHISAVDAVANHIEADLLAGLDRRVNLFELLRSTSADHRLAQIPIVAVLLGGWKGVEDNRGIGFDGTHAFVVRRDSLVARGNDAAPRQPSLPHDRCVDSGL